MMALAEAIFLVRILSCLRSYRYRGLLLLDQMLLLLLLLLSSSCSLLPAMFPAHVISQTGGVLKYFVWTDGTGGLGFPSTVLVLDVTLQVVSVLEDFLAVRTLDRFRRLAGRVVHAIIYWILCSVVVGHLFIIELLIVIVLLHGGEIPVVSRVIHGLRQVLLGAVEVPLLDWSESAVY